jgi:hypothetical protein
VTHAGTITLGVDLDGGGLGAKLAAEVRSQLAGLNGALGDVDLGRIDHSALGKMASEAERASHSTDDLADSTRKASLANSGLSRSTKNLTTALKENSRVSTANTIHLIRDYDRVADAADRSAQRRIEAATAAAAAEEAAASGGGGGGGGGRRRTTRGRGRGRGGGDGGLLSGASGAAIFNAGALAIGNIPAITTAVVNLAGAVQTLGQAGLTLPGIYAGIGASFGTAVIGFHGMSDAIKALNDAAASGDPKDLEKANKLLEQMAPNAAATSKAVSGFISGPWKDLQKNTAQTMFEGIDQTFNDLATKTMPTLTRGTAEVGSAWNKTFKEIGRVGGLDSTQSVIDKIFGNTADAQTRANAAIAPLVHGIGTLTAESSDFLPRLGDGLTKLTTRFDNFITRSANNGNLDKWINQGIEGADHLGTTILNIGKIITDLTKAAGGDGGLLNALDKGSTALEKWTSSAEGQDKLSRFFADGKEQLRQWLPILQNLGPLLLDIYQASRTWSDLLMPFLRDALGLLDKFPGLVQAGVLAFLAFKTISPFAGLLGDLTKANGLLDGLTNKSRTATGGGGRGGKFGGPGVLGPSLLIGGALSNLNAQTPQDVSAGGVLATLGGGALAGFEVAGPVGAALGTLGGAAVALTETFLAQKRALDAAHEEAVTPTFTPTVPATVAPTVGPGSPGTPGGGAAVTPPSIANLPAVTPTLPGLLGVPGEQGGAALSGADAGIRRLLDGLQQTRQEVVDTVKDVGVLGSQIHDIPNGHIEIDTNKPEVVAALEALGLKVTQLPNGHIIVQVAYRDARGNAVDPGTIGAGNALGISGPPVLPAHGAAGGAVWGGIRGRDSVPSLLMPGEHVFDVGDVAAMGGQSNVYRFRRALHFADGGAVPGLDPLSTGGDTVLGLLQQIRDLLSGKGGQGTPLVDTAKATTQIADASTGTGTGGQQLGPFGTPIKPRNPAYEAAAAAIQALGGDPEKFLGPNPVDYFGPGGPGAATLPGGAGIGGAGVDFGRYASVLSAFARSGNLGGDVTGLGLDANDTVIKAIVAARNKKKGGLDDATIAGLVDQVVGGGGYTGTLDTSNSSLISSLQTFREKLAKGKVGNAGTVTTSGTGIPLGLPGGGDASALVQLAQSASGGKYDWGASDLVAGLSDCSGAISDLVELITKGRPDSGRLFSTANAADVLTSLGATPGLIPGTLQIGFNSGHMAATLPNGVNFESGGGTGQGATYGGNAIGANDPRFTQQFSLPVSGAAALPSAGSPLGLGGAGGAPVPVWIVGSGPGFGGGLPGAPGAPGQLPPGVAPIVDALASSTGQVAADVSGDLISAIGQTPLPGLDESTLKRPRASNADLIEQRNPLALASLAGLNVPDFTRNGGSGQDFLKNQGPGFTANGQIFSDTGALLDRTLTSTEAANQARHQQLLAVLNEVKQRLSEEVLKPVVQAAVSEAINGIKDNITAQIGASMGQAAGPPIADAVRSAIPSDSGSSGGQAGFSDALGGLAGSLFADGGAVSGGIRGRDSVPALLMPDEHILNTADVAAMGGHANVYAFRRALHGRGLRLFAEGGAAGEGEAPAVFGSGLLGGWSLQPDAAALRRRRGE